MTVTSMPLKEPCRAPVTVNVTPFIGQVSKVVFKNDLLSFQVGGTECVITGLPKRPDWLLDGTYVMVDTRQNIVESVDPKEYEALQCLISKKS